MTPAASAAKAFMLSLLGVAVFLWFERSAGAFVASAVIVVLATAGTWFATR